MILCMGGRKGAPVSTNEPETVQVGGDTNTRKGGSSMSQDLGKRRIKSGKKGVLQVILGVLTNRKKKKTRACGRSKDYVRGGTQEKVVTAGGD